MPSDEFSHIFQALAADYRAGLPDKLRHIDALWQSRTDDPELPVRMRELLREFHSIAGAASTFGLAAVGDAAAAAEGFLGPLCEAGKPPSAAQRPELDTLIAALKQAAEAR